MEARGAKHEILPYVEADTIRRQRHALINCTPRAPPAAQNLPYTCKNVFRTIIRRQDGVPAPALARICRYATERTAGQIPVGAAHPPLLNPTPGEVIARGESQLAISCDHGSDASDNGDSDSASGSGRSSTCGNNSDNNIRSDTMCRRGTFRGTVFFIAEGHGKVVLDNYDETVGFRRGRGDDGGGSSTESLLAAAAFGNRRARRNERKRRRCGDGKGGGSNGERPGDDPVNSVGRDAHEEAETAVKPGPALGVATQPATKSEHKETEIVTDDQRGLPAAENHPTGVVCDEFHKKMQGRPSQVPWRSAAAASTSISCADGEWEDWKSGGGGKEECRPRLAALKRGDFFGVDPAWPTAAASSEPVSNA